MALQLNGDGTITGLAEGGLEDGKIINADIKDDTIAEDKLDISNSASDGQFLQYENSSNKLTWATVSSTPEGNVIKSTTNGNEAATKFLRANGSGGASWEVPPDTSGKLLQMVGGSSNNHTTIASTTKSTTNLYQEITPSKAGSKLAFWMAGHYSQNPNGGSYGPQVIVSLYKKIGSGSDTEVHQVTYDYIGTVDNVYYSHHFAVSYFDNTATLNTTDVIRYTIYAKLLNADHQMRFNPGGYSSLIIQEYDA